MKEDILLRNNTGNNSKKSLVEGFVVRLKEFELIYNNLKETSLNKNKQNYLIIGQRGAGKTSLMHRLKYAVEDDNQLNRIIIPIMFSEEQYYLSELVNLWENISIYLEDVYGWSNISVEIEKIIFSENDYERKVYELLCSKLATENKSLIIFIENIGMFYNKLEVAELNRLTYILTHDNNIRLIGTSTTFIEGKIDLSTTEFSYFKTIQLGGLSKGECESLLLKIASQSNKTEEIKAIISNYPGRVESLRRLTGGIPRTISYLFQIFLDNENGKAIKDLYLLIDTLTLLYKSELDRLSTQQQRVIDIIARRWDAIAVKEIVKGTRLESKNISKILAGLERDQFIERIATDSKNNLYRIKERFMNIWYLMRFGRKHDRENVVWLVRFFDAWCEKNELDKLIAGHIDNLKDGDYDVNAAIDMGNTFLSCKNVSDAMKSELFNATKSILPERLLNSVKWSKSNKGEINTLVQLISDKKLEEAITLIDRIEVKDLNYYRLASTLFLLVGDFNRSADAAKTVLSLDQHDASAALTLGIIYEDYIKDNELAIQYYNTSLLQTPFHPYAASRLGNIYYNNHDVTLAVKYHKMAIKKSFRPSLLSLAKIYIHENKFNDAETVLLEAQKHQVKDVNVYLGELYAKLNQPKKAQQFFELAVEKNEDDARLQIANFYIHKRKPDYIKAEFYYNEAITAGLVEAYYLLGRLYHRKLNNRAKAIEIYTEGMEHGQVKCIHQLAHIYTNKRDFVQGDKLFLKAIDMGENVAAVCMANNIYEKGRKDKKKVALQVLESNLPKIENSFFVDVVYAKLLLWNDEVEKSVEVLRNTYSAISKIKSNIENSEEDFTARTLLFDLVSYFTLLLAKNHQQIALQLFNDRDFDFKNLLKPIYYVLMELMKKEYPLEYLKAGEEFADTIKELKVDITRIKKKL